jgi:hypothetical protein
VILATRLPELARVRRERDLCCSHDVQNQGVSTKPRPKPRRLRTAGARLDLRDEVLGAGDELSFTVVNRGRRPLLAGAGYGFEVRTALVWRQQRLDQAFVAIGMPVEPGQRSREMSADVPEGFRPGRYRLTVTVTLLNAEGLPLRGRDDWPVHVKISQTFKITRPAA